MKRLIAGLMGLCILLSGCNSWMDGSYISVKPHLEENRRDDQQIVQARNYDELLSVLTDLVEDGTENSTIAMTAFDQEQIENNMDRAIAYITENHPMAAYAVEGITYEQGTTGGVSAVALTITYNNNLVELRRMKRVQGMEQAEGLITAALDQCEANVVLLVADYLDTDFVQLIENYADMHPESVMEIPEVTVSLYPDSGESRVVELRFTYQNNRDTLRAMQSMVQPVFDSARLYVSGDAADYEKYSQLCSFLIERYQYKIETSNTASYSLLRHGVGDSKAFAVVYASMCRQAGLECQVVSGTRAGESRFWNIICDDGVYYHLDLLACNETGLFQELTDSQMEGYVWDYSAYPACGVTDETVPQQTE